MKPLPGVKSNEDNMFSACKRPNCVESRLTEEEGISTLAVQAVPEASGHRSTDQYAPHTPPRFRSFKITNPHI